jgi:hypothetical protein
VRQHARAIRDHFGDRATGVYQGAWREDKDVVLDASDNVPHFSEAATNAAKRGERAIYDVKGERDIHTVDVKKKVRN